MNFPPYFKKKKAELDKYLESILSAEYLGVDADTALLLEAARYSSLDGGKRMRGVITLLITDLINPEFNTMPLAAGLELIHTYSLIHDDLPAMDNDDYRRGKLTCHKVYGEDIAILTGDFLMTLAYYLFSQELPKGNFKAENILQTISYISKNLGINGMVGGQVIDIKSCNTNIDKTLLEKMHLLKTGLFLEAAFCAPVLLIHEKAEWLEEINLQKYALNAGLLFQIIDDILDETGDEKKLGKKTGADKKLEKATYVSIMGLAKADKLAKEIYQYTLDMIKSVRTKVVKEKLTDIINIIYKRDI
ncbi:MAG: polyprenyl synthetase family protein [Candidatus Margulisbacteria bacterium]|nr:polyprenyl synthetase family protein [Candidatus Margulisiibacteriota bacterium]